MTKFRWTAPRTCHVYRTSGNGVFRVRDVSYDEDRLHGRKIGPALSLFRNVTINLLWQ